MSEKKIVGLEDIEADDTQFEEVPVPEWGPGKVVRLASLSASGMIAFSEDANKPGGDETSGAILVARCLVDGEGNRIGNETTPLVLLKRNPVVINRLAAAAMRLNGMRIVKVDETGANEVKVTEDVGNASSAASTGDSPTA